MNQESVIMTILLKQKQIDIKVFTDFFDDLFLNLFDEHFEELSYSLLIDNKLKSKSLTYSKKNIQKLAEASHFNGFEVLKLLPDWKYKSIDIHFAVQYTTEFNTQNSSIIITINKESFFNRYSTEKICEVYSGIANFLIANEGILTYGFIFSMDNTKFPNLFAAGVGNYSLAKKEREELQRWAERSDASDTCIWNVFWGNLITVKHLRPTKQVKNLEEFVGKNNFKSISESIFFFHLPNDNLSYPLKVDKLQAKISQLFTIL